MKKLLILSLFSLIGLAGYSQEEGASLKLELKFTYENVSEFLMSDWETIENMISSQKPETIVSLSFFSEGKVIVETDRGSNEMENLEFQLETNAGNHKDMMDSVQQFAASLRVVK
jgi:hypothetical protein